MIAGDVLAVRFQMPDHQRPDLFRRNEKTAAAARSTGADSLRSKARRHALTEPVHRFEMPIAGKDEFVESQRAARVSDTPSNPSESPMSAAVSMTPAAVTRSVFERTGHDRGAICAEDSGHVVVAWCLRLGRSAALVDGPAQLRERSWDGSNSGSTRTVPAARDPKMPT